MGRKYPKIWDFYEKRLHRASIVHGENYGQNLLFLLFVCTLASYGQMQAKFDKFENICKQMNFSLNCLKKWFHKKPQKRFNYMSIELRRQNTTNFDYYTLICHSFRRINGVLKKYRQKRRYAFHSVDKDFLPQQKYEKIPHCVVIMAILVVEFSREKYKA